MKRRTLISAASAATTAGYVMAYFTESPSMTAASYGLHLAVSTDGPSTFKADATFARTAGLADSSWTSLRSYNVPDRYLRHANCVLRIDPVSSSSSTTDKQDATFRVGY